MDRINTLLSYLEETPKDSFLRHALAMEYIKIDKLQEAKILLEQLLYDDPTYIGSYYQLAKLIEQNGDKENAIFWYEKGLKQAKLANERHAYNELQSALDELLYE